VTGGIREWLTGLGLARHVDLFAENDIDFDVLPLLSDDHLKEIGISLGDRVRLRKAIDALQGQERPAAPPAAGVTPATEARVPRSESERRQLTVMFCDLVGSTELSAKYDPEDLQEFISSYHAACSRLIAEFNGYVAKFMGDGVLAYFGYPQAQEKDAERAARAALAILDGIADLGAGKLKDLQPAVRIGIATGLVVVGDMIGEGSAKEANIVGETPNIAARLQALAGPNEVIIAPLTRELIGAALTCESLGEHLLKGIPEPVRAWRVERRQIADTESDETESRPAGALIGRQEELGLLLRSWEASRTGHGQVVSIQGEAGLGKSRLIEAVRAQIAPTPHVWVTLRCSPYHANSMLYPVTRHLMRVAGWKPDDSPETKLDKLETALKAQSLPPETAVPLYANLLSLPLPADRYRPLALSSREIREHTLDALTNWLFEEAEQKPVVQAWEDLHWADPTTLELLGIYISQSPTAAVLNVLTYRPEFRPPWPTRSHMTPITLSRLDRAEVEAMIAARAGGKSVPPEVLNHVIDKADGVPLYVEELTRTILRSDYLREETDRFALVRSLAHVSIPATLQDTLMARLDRLPRVRELAQLGAVLGREFAYEMLRALVEIEEPSLKDGLEQLVDAELLYQRGRAPRASYVFKHALIQDAAYGSLLKRTRQQYHRQVAALFEERFPDTVEQHPELVAHHHAEAGNFEKSAEYWLRAGELARAQSANLEAIAYFGKGVDSLRELPESERRARQELALQVPLGHANIVAKGHGAAGAQIAYARALELCERLGDAPELAATLFGLWRFYVVANPLDEAMAVAMRLHRIAEEKRQTELFVVACYARGYTALCKGDLAEARSSLADGVARYDREQRRETIYRIAQDPGVACRAYLAMTEWLLGYPDRAENSVAQSIELAEELEDPFSLAFALCFPGAIVTDARGGDAGPIVERGLEIARLRNFALWAAFAEVHRRSERFRALRSEPALRELAESVAAIPQMGVLINSPYFATHLARACLEMQKGGDGLAALEAVEPSMRKRGEYWWQAEVLRLKGELLLSRSASDDGEAERCFEQAREVARRQQAKSLELRAVTSLCRLWRRQGRQQRAISLLEECLSGLEEGAATADHKAARDLLTVGFAELQSRGQDTHPAPASVR
jgi:predicted ATPase/class 3 adenylate cyclase